MLFTIEDFAIRRRWEGVSLTWQSGVTSKSILLLWLFSIQCPDFSLIIFEAPFLEVCLRCNVHCFSSYLDIVGTMFLCSMFLVPSSLPFAESFFCFQSSFLMMRLCRLALGFVLFLLLSLPVCQLFHFQLFPYGLGSI